MEVKPSGMNLHIDAEELIVLRKALNAESVPSYRYSIIDTPHGVRQDNSVILQLLEDGIWYVYWYERGSESFVSAHSKLRNAIDDFWARLPTTGSTEHPYRQAYKAYLKENNPLSATQAEVESDTSTFL